jgi:hypothetical protein
VMPAAAGALSVAEKLDIRYVYAILPAAHPAVAAPPAGEQRPRLRHRRPWLATDRTLDPWRETPDLDVVHAGAWILPDEPALPDELVAFGRVAAVVHHGGAGTTTAARAGAPQVAVPQAGGTSPYRAGRIADLGIGAAHDGPTPTTESLSAARDGPPPRPAHERAPWPARSVPTGRRWPRRCCSASVRVKHAG